MLHLICQPQQKMFRLLEDSGILSFRPSHIEMMPYLWTIAIDLSVLFALYKYKAGNIYVHALIALFVSLTTFITTFPIIIKGNYPMRHFIIGLIAIVLTIIQVILGVITKGMQLISWSHPYLIYYINVIHKGVGYLLIALGKVPVYLMLSLNPSKTNVIIGLAIAEAVLIVIWCICKIKRFTLEEIVLPSFDKCKAVEGVKQVLKDTPRVVVFANYVFNAEPLLLHHPCGYRLIDSVKGMDMDRFIYGTYPSERFPLIPASSHNHKSLSLLDSPVAKITIPSIYSGLESEINEVKLSAVRVISDKFSIYELKLQLKSGKLQFLGYTSLRQIGRYYSLTLDNSVTRLYTSVGFLDPKNISFLSRELAIKDTVQSKIIDFNNSNAIVIGSLQEIQQIQLEQASYISLLVKLYPTGKQTPKIIAKKATALHLSEPRGEGLKLQNLAPGKVIVVAGGTGLYPFSDLLDLLFKDSLEESNGQLRAMIYKHDPILQGRPFERFKFHLMLAVHDIEEIHPITLQQILRLSGQSSRFKLTMRMSHGGEQFKAEHKEIVFTSEHFDSLVLSEMGSEEYSKVWVCGPPAMTTSIVNMFDKAAISEDKYQFV